MTAEQMASRLTAILDDTYSTTPSAATSEQLYGALCLLVRKVMSDKRRDFRTHNVSEGGKQIHYLSMEFLLGRSLKNSLFNLGLTDAARQALAALDVDLDRLYEQEPDAGLGNGGLGRLAACYLDAMATTGLYATGYSICYEFGIFRQKLVDGWQTELPDNWLPGGKVWLKERPDERVEIQFGGEIHETWDESYHHVEITNSTSVWAIPCDMYVSGYGDGVSKLRLYKAESGAFDMGAFNSGNFARALQPDMTASVISKVLYPNDNFFEGKQLRLRQQYFFSAAAICDIVKHHLTTYGTMENFAEKNAVHINDTHPTLAIPELMRVLLDECGFGWEKAWDLVTRTFAYTNHTILSEALETWDAEMFRQLLPRIYQIVVEINERFCRDLFARTGDLDRVSRMAIVGNHQVRMANLCVAACHHTNGVSRLHSDILRDGLFREFAELWPEKFTNVTNGIASRRWLMQSNPGLTSLITERIGDAWTHDLERLRELLPYQNDPATLDALARVKRENKARFSDYVARTTGRELDPDSVFDVQVKRLHEYKRQQLNALHILTEYFDIKEHPEKEFLPKTYIFGAKAAPGYYMAKQIIRLLATLGELFEKDEAVRGKLRVLFLEDYRVTLSELLMPAAEISEQISLAGKEASGTGNMKLMENGAITLGTLDGANVEIAERVGSDNILIFGMTRKEAAEHARSYYPRKIYEEDPRLQRAIQLLYDGILGHRFTDVADMLLYHDTYMTLADFDAYVKAHARADELYRDPKTWNRMSLVNIAESGYFCADRAVLEYAKNIWGAR